VWRFLLSRCLRFTSISKLICLWFFSDSFTSGPSSRFTTSPTFVWMIGWSMTMMMMMMNLMMIELELFYSIFSRLKQCFSLQCVLSPRCKPRYSGNWKLFKRSGLPLELHWVGKVSRFRPLASIFGASGRKLWSFGPFVFPDQFLFLNTWHSTVDLELSTLLTAADMGSTVSV